ncbi:hypothetical protein DL767_011304 [Monosporascus sp. MG133]|nr:hypothetical protein DL767_011304 [Monosporascus sp. MG133]
MDAGKNIGLGELNENRIDRRRQIANVRYPLSRDYILKLPHVGQHFTDHFQIVMYWRLKGPSKRYVIGSDNPLFSEPQYGLGAHISYTTSIVTPSEGLAAAIGADEGVRPNPRTHYLLRTRQATMETLTEYEAKPAANVAVDGTHISSVMDALKPTSRGSICIQSGDIADRPIINPNYFATEVDRHSWRAGMRDLIALMTGNRTLKQYIIAGEAPPPGFSPVIANSTDERLAGVDTDLRVYGVGGLRVAGATIIPIAIAAHTQAPVYGLTEHASAIFRAFLRGMAYLGVDQGF